MMSKKKESSGIKKGDTLIGKDFSIKGRLEAANGSVRVDGYFEGELIVGGDLIIGESGNVVGTISAKNITIAGEVQGLIEARGKLELMPTAKVMADAKMVFLIVEDGAFLQGQCEPLPRGDLKERGKALFANAAEAES
ncbi:MAG TPA: polymer-forming cytoskeletal protein [Bacillota bacterium]|jgi:cytoskeletal protein CcmA (bactofilin family)|nr:polymer-forming cytoskeletal protein [Bacillota bacterium]HOL10255.1 polymer-forming cytoskeletal protein [Bacillota bacterium]